MKLSTGKRFLAFVCALAMVLGIGLQGNVITARAADPTDPTATGAPAGPTEQEQAYMDLGNIWGELNKPEKESEKKAYFSDPKNVEKVMGLIATAGDLSNTPMFVGADKNAMKQMMADIEAYIKQLQNAGEETVLPKQPSEIALERAEKDLKTYHPLIKKTGTPLRMVNLGEYHTVGKKLMQKIAVQVGYGYNVVLFSRVDRQDRVILIPAGSTVDTSLDWYGPDCLSELYEDLTDAYKAQDKSLSKFLKVKNIIDAR